MTDVELDARVTALEENGGGGGTGRTRKLLMFITISDLLRCRVNQIAGIILTT